MANKEKKRHHYVPQVYLKKFAHSRRIKGSKEHFFVSTYDKERDVEEVHIDVENICFKTKLYTLDSSSREKRESIENFYASTIESDYNKFYEIITKDEITNISLEERELIIITIINMHLRNLFWFKALDDFWRRIIEDHDYSIPTNIYTEDGDILFPFETSSVDEIIAENKKKNRDAFIHEHLRLTINLVRSHFSDIIFVDSDRSNTGFITSDRPVICTSIADSFRMPVDSNYILTIVPNKNNEEYDLGKIVRNNPFINARTFNIMSYETAQRYVISNDINNIRIAKEDYLRALKRMT